MIKSVIYGQFGPYVAPLSFNLWVPRPDNLARRGFARALKQKFKRELHETAWCETNWGCARDGTDFKLEVGPLPEDPHAVPTCTLTFLSESIPFPIYAAIAHVHATVDCGLRCWWCSDVPDEAGSLVFQRQWGHCDTGMCCCPTAGIIVRKLPGRTLIDEWESGAAKEDRSDPNWEPQSQREITIEGNKYLEEAYADLWVGQEPAP